MIIVTIFLGLQLFVHLQRRVLAFGVSEGGWHFRSDISLQCGSVDPPAQVSVQSSAWVCRVGGLLLQRLAVLVPEFLHSRALGKDRPN